MSNMKFGLVTWEEEIRTPGKPFNNDRPKENFLKLTTGSNVLRVITRPFQYVLHKYKLDGWKSPFKIKCSMTDDCPLCNDKFTDENDKVRHSFPQKEGWYVGVIDRKTKAYRILDIGVTVYNQIKKYNKNGSWGAPDQYDVDINVDPNGGATGYYTLMPLGKSPLSDEDVEIKKNVDIEVLKRRCSPISVEQVTKQIEFALNRVGGKPPTNSKTAVKAAPKAAKARAVEEEERAPDPVMDDSEDLDFPPATVSA